MGVSKPMSGLAHPLSVAEDPSTAAIVLLTWATDDTSIEEQSPEQLREELARFRGLRATISVELARAGRRGDRAQQLRLRSLRDEVDSDIDEIECELSNRGA